MSRNWLLGAVGLLVAALFWLARPMPQSAAGVLPNSDTIPEAARRHELRSQKPLEISRARIAEESPEEVHFVADIFEVARRLNRPETNGEEDIAILQDLLAFYRRSNQGSNPDGGLNYHIVQELLGHNKHRLAVLPRDLAAISAEGELSDRWGTPYFLHPVSEQLMEIRSAGPDRQFWTKDDIHPGIEADQETLR